MLGFLARSKRGCKPVKEADYLREQARDCRKQAAQAPTPIDRRALRQLADYYEREAGKLDAGTLKVMH